MSRPIALKLLVAATIVGAAGMVYARCAGPPRQPEAYVLLEDWRDWKTDSGLRRAMDALTTKNRTLLKWWLVEKATGKSTPLAARTIGEALDEARRFRLYAAPRSMGLPAPPENKMLRVVR